MSAEKQSTPTAKDDSKPAAGQTTLPLRPKPGAAAADPDEDDLDDLDDVLDEFSASKAEPAAAAAAPAKAPAKDGEDLTPEDFDDELAKEMAKLISDVDSNPEMKKQIEAMMKEIGSVVDQQIKQEDAPAGSSSKAPASPVATEDSFQETIRKTMERMQASGDKATAEASADGGDDFIAEMLKQMQGGGSEEDFSKMLLGMMEQLTNKEILYEPMKELHEKFPGWMETNKDKTPAADLARYQEQQRLVGEIVARFERSGYSDDNGQDREYIAERMQQMQAQGSPPTDLVGDMDDAQKAMGDLDAGCTPQ